MLLSKILELVRAIRNGESDKVLGLVLDIILLLAGREDHDSSGFNSTPESDKVVEELVAAGATEDKARAAVAAAQECDCEDEE